MLQVGTEVEGVKMPAENIFDFAELLDHNDNRGVIEKMVTGFLEYQKENEQAGKS